MKIVLREMLKRLPEVLFEDDNYEVSDMVKEYMRGLVR